MTDPAHLTEMAGIFPTRIPADAAVLAADLRLASHLTADPVSAYEGWEFLGDPSGINIPEVLRLRRLWKCHDMLGFCRYRYNMFQAKGHWFPGVFATDEALARVEAHRAPAGIDLVALLAEAHQAFFLPK